MSTKQITQDLPHWKITSKEYIMGRDKDYFMQPQEEANMWKLLNALNRLRDAYGKAMIVTSGWRPGRYNQGYANKSAHLSCEACDFSDVSGELAKWCLHYLPVLENCGLYMESPESTRGWVHLQTRRPGSGNRVFKP